MKKPSVFASPIETKEGYRWPKRGDRLLRPSGDWNDSVEFSSESVSREAQIWRGYVLAGSTLIEACGQNSADRHFLIYPILFNYRHSVELAMKWIIDRYGGKAEVRLMDSERNHDLKTLWRSCRQVIVRLGSEGNDDPALRIVEQVVKDFHDLDQNAMAFRYSKDKSGRTLRLPDTAIDLKNLRDVMEAVNNYFDGTDGQLHANVSASDY